MIERGITYIWKGVKLFCVALVVVAIMAGLLANATRGVFTEEFQRRMDGMEKRVQQIEVLKLQNLISIDDREKIHDEQEENKRRIGEVEKAVEKLRKAVTK